MAITITFTRRVGFVVVLAILLVILLGAVLGVGLSALMMAVALPVKQKWRWALWLVAMILIVLAFWGRLF